MRWQVLDLLDDLEAKVKEFHKGRKGKDKAKAAAEVRTSLYLGGYDLGWIVCIGGSLPSWSAPIKRSCVHPPSCMLLERLTCVSWCCADPGE
jgi:hypothetical protein